VAQNCAKVTQNRAKVTQIPVKVTQKQGKKYRKSELVEFRIKQSTTKWRYISTCAYSE
jgi:hypothetical protein